MIQWTIITLNMILVVILILIKVKKLSKNFSWASVILENLIENNCLMYVVKLYLVLKYYNKTMSNFQTGDVKKLKAFVFLNILIIFVKIAKKCLIILLYIHSKWIFKT